MIHLLSFHFTSCVAICLATPLMSQNLQTGCYERKYTSEHLQAHPAQIVDLIRVKFARIDAMAPDILSADVHVLLANQGHAARDGYGGQRVQNSATNFMSPHEFHVECDGGSLSVIHHDAESVLIETTGFRLIGDDAACVDDSLETNLSEQIPGTPTRYVLFRAEDAACDW